MKELTENEMLLVLGGVAKSDKSCSDVEAEASAHYGDPDFDWDRWADEYELFCNGIKL